MGLFIKVFIMNLIELIVQNDFDAVLKLLLDKHYTPSEDESHSDIIISIEVDNPKI